MKIYFRGPGGVEFYMERKHKPRQPMSTEHFMALCGLAAGAMILSFFLALAWAP